MPVQSQCWRDAFDGVCGDVYSLRSVLCLRIIGVRLARKMRLFRCSDSRDPRKYIFGDPDKYLVVSCLSIKLQVVFLPCIFRETIT